MSKIEIDLEVLDGAMCQSMAAALAVWASALRENCRKHIERVNSELDHESTEHDLGLVKDYEALCYSLTALEQQACDSISSNDGNVVKWIGQAAKQMNPLLP